MMCYLLGVAPSEFQKQKYVYKNKHLTRISSLATSGWFFISTIDYSFPAFELVCIKSL